MLPASGPPVTDRSDTAARPAGGRVFRRALARGNDATRCLLREVVHIDIPTTGTVRLKKYVEKMDEMMVRDSSMSARTVRVNR
ncbi:hypothetical protein Ga0074812_11998 [Parafrankia irregularis]|uniref:von Willebrand factor type A C-terminal domain-containing protein n=1 Tax=Parafrankia irregularis TaxID=795642 RepID=A0A0S4QS79_9ACTN|nr:MULTISPECIES: hypothetical protein [Parafrankia]MBE3204611.1 hypothetical protein [Parafrankia sp. CH37]CUU58464.1 hypothetical protein Ga0074812_11998 [Parafrankia irregularis]